MEIWIEQFLGFQVWDEFPGFFKLKGLEYSKCRYSKCDVFEYSKCDGLVLAYYLPRYWGICEYSKCESFTIVVSKFGARDGHPLRKTSKRGTRNTHDVLA